MKKADKFTLVRIETETLELLKGLSVADMRTAPTEIRFLVERELARRINDNVAAIQDLPHPEDAEVVPLVIVGK